MQVAMTAAAKAAVTRSDVAVNVATAVTATAGVVAAVAVLRSASVRGIILLVRTTLRPGPGESGLGMAYHACAQLRRPFRLRLRPSRDVARGEIGGGLTAGIIAALLQLLVAPRRPGHLRRPARRRRRARLNGEVDDSAAIGDM